MGATAAVLYREMEAQIEQQRTAYTGAITALNAVPGNDTTINDLRAKLERLAQDLAEAKDARTRATPQQERALRRQQTLDRFSRFRNERFTINFETGETTYRKGSGERVLRKSLDLGEAAALLGINEDDLKATGIPLQVAWLVDEPDTDPNGVQITSVDTAHAIYILLTKSPHDRVRQLLRDLGVRALVKHPRTKEERALHGLTPAEERVTVQFLADPHDAAQVRPSVTNPSLLT